MSRRAVRYTVTFSAQGRPSRAPTEAAMGSTPEGCPRRTSPTPREASHSLTTVPSMRAATARHMALVSAKARWQLPMEMTRASRSTWSAP